jgi:hypothetical protein
VTVEVTIYNMAEISEQLQGDVVCYPGEDPFIRIDRLSKPGAWGTRDIRLGDVIDLAWVGTSGI